MLNPNAFINNLAQFSRPKPDSFEDDDLTVSIIPASDYSTLRTGRDVAHLLNVMNEHPEENIRDTVAEFYSPEVMELTVDAEANSLGVASEAITKGVVDCMQQALDATKHHRLLYKQTYPEQMRVDITTKLKSLTNRLGMEGFKKRSADYLQTAEIKALNHNDVQRMLKFMNASSEFFLKVTPDQIFQQMCNGQTSVLKQLKAQDADWTSFIEVNDSEDILMIVPTLPSDSRAGWPGTDTMDICNTVAELDTVADGMLEFMKSWKMRMSAIDAEHRPLLLDPGTPGRDGQINLTHAFNAMVFVSGWMATYVNLSSSFWVLMNRFSQNIHGSLSLKVK